MHHTSSHIRLAGLGLAALLATASVASAETVQLKADLKGTSTAAKGDAAVTFAPLTDGTKFLSERAGISRILRGREPGFPIG